MNEPRYICDDKKNVNCKKTACLYSLSSKHKDCYCTTEKEFELDSDDTVTLYCVIPKSCVANLSIEQVKVIMYAQIDDGMENFLKYAKSLH